MTEISVLSTEPQNERALEGRLIDGARQVLQEKTNSLTLLKQEALQRIISPAQKTLHIALIIGVLLSAGCGNTEVRNQSATELSTSVTATEPVSSATVPTATTGEAPKPKQETRSITIPGVTITLDNDGIPIKYRLADGKEIGFNKETLELVRQKAITSHEPEIAEVIGIPQEVKEQKSPQDSKEHPVLTEAPKDIVSEVELRAKGIDIIQADNTQLFIRKQAFEAGGPLADYAKGEEHLTIALLNAPFVSDFFMNDPKYAKIKAAYLGEESILPSSETKFDPKKYRAEQIQINKDRLATVKTSNLGENIMQQLKAAVYWYEHIDEATLIDQFTMTLAKSAEMAGFYMRAGVYLGQTPIGTDIRSNLVVISTGVQKPASDRIIISFDSQGQTKVNQLSLGTIAGFEPKEDQSFPNPKKYKRNPEASPDKPWTYPYAAQDPGFMLRHELAHDELVTSPTRKAKSHMQDFLTQEGRLDINKYEVATAPNKSEYDTDEKAMAGIRQAWQKWVDSGYKDDSGYYFAFKLANGKFILTKNLAESEHSIPQV